MWLLRRISSNESHPWMGSWRIWTSGQLEMPRAGSSSQTTIHRPLKSLWIMGGKNLRDPMATWIRLPSPSSSLPLLLQISWKTRRASRMERTREFKTTRCMIRLIIRWHMEELTPAIQGTTNLTIHPQLTREVTHQKLSISQLDNSQDINLSSQFSKWMQCR